MMDVSCASCIGLDEETMEKIERRAVNLYLEQAVHNTPINPFDIIRNRGYEMITLSYFMSNSTYLKILFMITMLFLYLILFKKDMIVILVCQKMHRFIVLMQNY